MQDFFPEETALRQRIAEAAAAGRTEEREQLAWQLADMIMSRTLPRRYPPGALALSRVE